MKKRKKKGFYSNGPTQHLLIPNFACHLILIFYVLLLFINNKQAINNSQIKKSIDNKIIKLE